jgi:hypothetical protein
MDTSEYKSQESHVNETSEKNREQTKEKSKNKSRMKLATKKEIPYVKELGLRSHALSLKKIVKAEGAESSFGP